MKTLRVVLLLGVIVSMGLYVHRQFELSAIAASGDDAAPPKFALLVGINDYKRGSGIRNLSGAHNDVRLMRALLKDFAFKEEAVPAANPTLFPCGAQKETSGIKTLCSAQATKSAILAAFDTQLIKNAKDYWQGAAPDPARGPMVVFYYSGHGSQVPDNEPIEGEKTSDLLIDEADGWDETLVPHDTDTLGSRDIRDDDFKKRIDVLKGYTTNIVFMADSCHSGTISRGPGARGIVHENFKNVRPNAKGVEDRDMPADNKYVTISGSLATQLSYEDELPDPATRKPTTDGFLTYYFVQAVRQNPGVTYREVIGLVRNALSAAGKPQTPQVEGDIDRVVFGAAGAAGRKGIAIKCEGPICTKPKEDPKEPSSPLRLVQIDGGEVIGAKVGGPIAIYAPGTVDLTGDKARIAMGTITASNAFSSEAEILFSDAKMADLPPLSKVALISPSFTDAKRRVAIDIKGSSPTDAAVERMKKLSADLKEHSSFYAPTEASGVLRALENGQHNWDLAVVRGTYADFKAGMEKKPGSKDVTPNDQEGYFITDQGGIPLYDLWIKADDPRAATTLQDALEKHAKVINIRALSNQVSGLNGKVRVEQIRYKGVSQKPDRSCIATPYTQTELEAMVSGDAPTIRRSEAFDIKITNDSERRLYFYVYSVDSAGAIDLIFPIAGANDQIAPGQSYFTSQGNPCQLLGFRPDSPTGFETVKVLISEKPVQADLLTSPAIQRKGVDTFLEKMLRQAGSNTRTGCSFCDNRVDDWTAFNVNYTVVP